MRIQKFSTKSVSSNKKGKNFGIVDDPNEIRGSASETCSSLGILERAFFRSFVLVAALIFSLLFVSSEKIIADNTLGDYRNNTILPPPSPEEVIEMKDVFFGFNQFDIMESAKAVLEENAEILRQNPDIIVFIQGNCDAGENIEEKLGANRANAVSRYIARQGVDPQRLKPVDKCGDSYVSLKDDEIPWTLDRMVHFIPVSTKHETLDVALN